MPITPDVLRLNELFRRMLLTNERRAASAMVRFYGVSWQRLQQNIKRVTGRINAMIAAGEDISRGAIVRLEQMRTLQKQVEQELRHFSQYADLTISAQERTAIAAAERQAYELINASFPGTINDFVQIDFYRLPSKSVESLVGFLEDGSPLADLLTKYTDDAGKQFADELVSGLVSGQGALETARKIRQAYGMGLTKALEISRTETLRAYRTATQQSYEANSDVLKGWVRSAVKDDMTCMACILLDQKFYELNEHMDDHINGRCLCADSLVMTHLGERRIDDIDIGDLVLTHKKRYKKVTGISQRLYDGYIINFSYRDGFVRLTPQHQVFINGKWIQAKHHCNALEFIKALSNYTGIVCDLQVEDDHSFVAGGIVVHNCAMIPVTKTYAELGIDAPEPEYTPQSGREWFEQQPEAVQRKILGAGKWQAWKDGLFDLDDIPRVTHSTVWGDSWTPKPLYKLLGESAPVGSYAEWVKAQEEALLQPATSIRVIPEFKTKQEAIQWGLDNGVAREIVFTRGVKLEGVRDAYSAILEVRDRFGVSPLRYIGDPRNAPITVKFGSRYLAAYAEQIDSIVFRNVATDATKLVEKSISGNTYIENRRPLSQVMKFLEEKPESYDAAQIGKTLGGRVFSFTDNTKSIMYHEMGHRIGIETYISPELHTTIRETGYRYLLSDYALETKQEFYAEAFSIYMSGDQRRLHPEVIQLFERLEKK